VVVIQTSFLFQITTYSYLGIYALSPKSKCFLDCDDPFDKSMIKNFSFKNNNSQQNELSQWHDDTQYATNPCITLVENIKCHTELHA
jgi:hypothetical protein